VFVNVVKACIQIEEIAKKCKTKNRMKEPQKISRNEKVVCILMPLDIFLPLVPN
jgi:hypothetical protein